MKNAMMNRLVGQMMSRHRLRLVCGGIVKKLLTETLISANIFYRKRCYHKATVRLSYVVIKKAT